MNDRMYEIARQVTDDVMGSGAYAETNRGHPDYEWTPMMSTEMYAVSAVHKSGRQLPTFYLLTHVQGIVSPSHAAEIAARIVGPDCHIHVVPTSFHAHEGQVTS